MKAKIIAAIFAGLLGATMLYGALLPHPPTCPCPNGSPCSCTLVK